jgi:hypothetical protein
MRGIDVLLVGGIEQPKIEIGDRCLAIFVDDTGHEDLKGQSVYSLGGCAALGRDLERIINQPWRQVRERITGLPTAQLHASSLVLQPAHIDAIANFFQDNHFWRFAAAFTKETKLVDEFSRMKTMKAALQNRINAIVGATLCKQAVVIFESSQRTDKLIQDAFLDLEITRGQKSIPFECCFMPKSAAEPALEVADFVMHAVGGQVRQNRKQPGIFRADFCAVFHSIEPHYTSYTEIEAVIRGPLPAA